ncbi:MAG TPA: chemoreceptor glutamine deamidase CheD [Sedimenticola thiotaurini]|uniref:Probable chemoreceptor glutamine deamidase CheD n=1 Tax=Sedimenticola thiotaurini TaxID=1543721 RepID=A0A831W487_9GAMM|nr:chemoreceptor glutamine deamidase CheD [Sedimenticola thiotaurini]
MALSKRSVGLPPPVPGFERINRYWDRKLALPAAKILPGEYYVTRDDEMITTVLGSCVSACIRDRVFGIGGMNHFMLPESEHGGWGTATDPTSTATRYGNYAMEHMINEILKLGGHRRNLEVKLFGGGRIINNTSDVGARNIDFVRSYLETEGLPVVGEDLGGIHPRRIQYFPRSGRARVKKLRHLHDTRVIEREQAYRRDLEQAPVAGEVELF